ncbi:MAG: ATP-binding protein [Desulfobacteraceae bacterium]|nr:ATP-binding protein [Desulfobacteraceae bacterium]
MDSKQMTSANGSISDQRLTEIKYHQKLNWGFVITALPGFLFFSIFYFLRGNYLQGFIFSILSLNAIVTSVLGLRVKDHRKMLLNKQAGTAIAFTLLAVSLISGLLSKDVYIAFPWIFIYSVAVLLMFGERIGIYFALGFSLIVVIVLFAFNFPAWNADSLRMLKYNSAFSLFCTLTLALVAERSRVRMRNGLIDARNKYKASEERQRQTNEELKSEIDMRVRSEKALAQSETRYRALFEESAVSLWEENYVKVKNILDNLPQESADDLENYLRQNPNELSKCINSIWITAVNRATLNLYGAQNFKEMLKNIGAILPSDLLGYMAGRITSLYNTGTYSTQLEIQTFNGKKLHLLVSSTIPAGYEQTWEKVFTSVFDISERVAMEEEKKRVEQQIQHTRQIQAIASLAGGIAHQFNNALAVISGNLDLLELNEQDHEENMRFIGSLRGSSDRITRLTEQLLAYARGGKYQPKDFPIKELVEDLLKNNKLIRKTSFKVTTHFEEDLYLAGGDITQIKMVLEAVLTNAVEAMEGGGEIMIHTCKKQVGHNSAGTDSHLPAGDYAIISIKDQGIGMDEATRQRIFEPFFTTKFVGRGLGMAAAYGIVRNHDGMIEVESEPNKGTRVMIYLPSVDKPKGMAFTDASKIAA